MLQPTVFLRQLEMRIQTDSYCHFIIRFHNSYGRTQIGYLFKSQEIKNLMCLQNRFITACTLQCLFINYVPYEGLCIAAFLNWKRDYKINYNKKCLRTQIELKIFQNALNEPKQIKSTKKKKQEKEKEKDPLYSVKTKESPCFLSFWYFDNIVVAVACQY